MFIKLNLKVIVSIQNHCLAHFSLIVRNVKFLYLGSSFGNVNVDSARQNLASSFVNAFLNAGFGSDKLLMDEKSKWIYKNKDIG